ncbi:MAG: YfgM family protein [Granulosicoccus sp.]
MEYETEEQQVEALKAWWTENGRAVIAGVVLGAGVIGGWSFWKDLAQKKIVSASDTYSSTMEAVAQADADTALNLADKVQSDNPGHLYASYASFAAARAAVENGDLEEAANRLEWVVDNAPQDDVKLIAQVRLARVKGASGDPAAGLSALPGSFPDSFAGLVEEARGDLHVMAGDEEAARAAYKAASASEYVANREGLTMKLNELAQPGDLDNSGSESTS